MITLRPYQQEAVLSVKHAWDAGIQNVLGTMATGGGKTLVFLSLLNDILAPGHRALIIAHRKELIDQPVARLLDYYPDWKGRIGVVMAGQDEPASQIVVATIQTLTSRPRLDKILANGVIDYLVVDECHHNTDKNSYSEVLARLREANPDMLHLGVTATPIRADEDGLGGVYEKEVFHYGIKELIEKGYLAQVRWLAIQTTISIRDVAVHAGDFSAKQLADVFDSPACFDLVVASHKKYAAGRQAIAFTATVASAHELAKTFREAGIVAASADGTTEKSKRAQILDDFANGNTEVLCNVGLYTEGLDVPQASCIHQVRPTKSDGLYTQMVGRALRIYPGKEDALILDYCPIDDRNVIMMGDVLGCPLPKKDLIEKKDEEEPGYVQAGFTFDGHFKMMDGTPAELITRQLDYLNMSPWSWYRKDGYMTLGLGMGQDKVDRTLIVTPIVDGKMTLYWIRKEEGGLWESRLLMQADSFEKISEYAERIAQVRGEPGLAQKQRGWRKLPASDKQIEFARKLGVWKDGTSRGDLAKVITHVLAVRQLRKLI